MVIDNKHSDEDLTEPFPPGGSEAKMPKESEHSDDETSYASAAGSRGGLSSVTGGFPAYSPKDEEDSMEKVTMVMQQKLQSTAAHPSTSPPKTESPQQRTGEVNSPSAKQE